MRRAPTPPPVIDSAHASVVPEAAKQPDHGLLQRLVFRREHLVAEPPPDLLGDRLDQRVRLFRGLSLRGDPNLHLAGGRQERDRRVRRPGEEVVDALGERRLTDPRAPEHAGSDHASCRQRQLRQDRPFHHLDHLFRNARHGVDPHTIGQLRFQSRRGPTIGLDVPRAIGHVGLAEVALGHLSPAEGSELLPEHLLELRMAHHGRPQEHTEGIARDVVLRRPEPPRHDHDLGA